MTDLDLNIALEPLLVRLAALVAERLNGAGAGAGKQDPEPDRLLDVDEVASRLGVSRRWVYGHRLPFVVRLPGRTLRYSERGLERYIERKQST